MKKKRKRAAKATTISFKPQILIRVSEGNANDIIRENMKVMETKFSTICRQDFNI
ncbi:MAG: hypothetical protein UHU19_07070 [Lachnospiraceae bacterium]|nr:hypothetical protein [Lachnospiraceae bacterium]